MTLAYSRPHHGHNSQRDQEQDVGRQHVEETGADHRYCRQPSPAGGRWVGHGQIAEPGGQKHGQSVASDLNRVDQKRLRQSQPEGRRHCGRNARPTPGHPKYHHQSAHCEQQRGQPQEKLRVGNQVHRAEQQRIQYVVVGRRVVGGNHRKRLGYEILQRVCLVVPEIKVQPRSA